MCQTFHRASWNVDPPPPQTTHRMMVKIWLQTYQTLLRKLELYEPQLSWGPLWCVSCWIYLHVSSMFAAINTVERWIERPLARQFIIATIGSVFMTSHWKDGAFPEDDLTMLNPRWLVQLSGCRLNWRYFLCAHLVRSFMQGKRSFKNGTSQNKRDKAIKYLRIVLHITMLMNLETKIIPVNTTGQFQPCFNVLPHKTSFSHGVLSHT